MASQLTGDLWYYLGDFLQLPEQCILLQASKSLNLLAWKYVLTGASISRSMDQKKQDCVLDHFRLSLKPISLKLPEQLVHPSLAHIPNLVSITVSRVTNSFLSTLSPLFNLTHVHLLNWSEHVTNEGILALSQLTSLQVLDVEYCNITSSGIKQLSHLTSLTYIRFPGEISLEVIATFTSLQRLNLDNGAFMSLKDDEFAPVSLLTNLRHLDLQACHCLTGKALSYLTNTTKLEYLCLDNLDPLIDQDLSYLNKMTSLAYLRLNSELISTEALRQMSHHTPNMNSFKLPNSPLVDDGCFDIFRNWKLQKLNIRWTSSNDLNLEFMTSLKKLRLEPFNRTLSISKLMTSLVSLSIKSPSFYPGDMNLPNLKSLSLIKCNLKEILFLKNCPLLQELNLLQIKELQAYDSLSSLKNLTSLYIGQEGTTSNILTHLKELTNLESLQVAELDAGDEELEYLSRLIRLKYISFGSFQGMGGTTLCDFSWLSTLRNLESLNLQPINDKKLKTIKNFDIERLGLNDYMVTDEGMEYLRSFSKLSVLGMNVTWENIEKVRKAFSFQKWKDPHDDR